MAKARRKGKPTHHSLLTICVVVFIVTYLSIVTIMTLGKFVGAADTRPPHNTTQQQGTFDFKSVTPKAPVNQNTPAGTGPSSPGPITPGTLITGGPVSPNSPYYCIDDEDPEGCDDQTAFHVPKGTGGPAGSCSTIMDAAHKLVSSLPQGLKDFRDSLNPAIINTCHNTGTYPSGYISTFFVIDAYNLAGYSELSKKNANHVTGSGLLTWWRAMSVGYNFLPYTPAVLEKHAIGQQSLNGCVIFLQMPSGGVHVGIFNALEIVNAQGDGVLSIVQSGARYFIDRFPVVGWDVKNTTPLHQTVISNIAGFGCHQ